MNDDENDPMLEDDARRRRFRDPGGRSALHAGARRFACPTCKIPRRLTAADVAAGYQCDACADRDEGHVVSYLEY